MRQGQTEPTMAGGLRPIRVLIVVALAIAIVVVATEPSAAVPNEGGVVAQQVPFESPAPDADAKAWSGPLAPLPLWGQVYIVSAVSLGAFFFVPPAFGSLFRLLRPLFRWLRPKGKHL